MSIRNALLGLLAEAPMSGYDLTKRFEHSLGRVWPVRHNQIYTELKQLAADGLIDLTAYGPRGRKIYSLTESGLAACRDWLRARPESIERSMRFEPLLRMNFLWLLDAPEAGAILKREAAHYRDQAAWLKDQVAKLPDDGADAAIVARRAVGLIGARLYGDIAESCQALEKTLNDAPGAGS